MIYAEDVDGDGDMDVLSAYADTIAWYENLMITNIVHHNPIPTPDEFRLYNNYPNSFNPSTIIEFDLPKTSEVTLKIFNMLGEELTTLVSDRLSGGSHSYEWDASGITIGIYLYRLEAEGFVQTKKMILMQ